MGNLSITAEMKGGVGAGATAVDKDEMKTDWPTETLPLKRARRLWSRHFQSWRTEAGSRTKSPKPPRDSEAARHTEPFFRQGQGTNRGM